MNDDFRNGDQVKVGDKGWFFVDQVDQDNRQFWGFIDNSCELDVQPEIDSGRFLIDFDDVTDCI